MTVRKAIALVIALATLSCCHGIAGVGHDLTRMAEFSQRAIDSQVYTHHDARQEAR